TINKNGEEATQYTDEPYIYDLGIVTPDDEVIVIISIEDSEYGYIDFYPYYINEDALNKGYEILSNQSLNVDSFEETKISGTISVDSDSLFFTSIPYDKGWTVRIDGVEIAEEDYVALRDAYLCFNIPAGEHTVELSFMPQGLLLGAGISAFTVLALIFAAIIFAKRRRRNVNAPFVYVPVVTETQEENTENVTEEPVSVEMDIPAEEACEETAAEEEISIIEEEIEKINSEETNKEE
ncbi:MAG: YfhO family protein, partial [Clostridia bacterium]|nr:YfhO family protein [Clostridia bacterium]